MKKTPKRDCTNCGWGVEWEPILDYRGEEILKGRCRFQPLPAFCIGPQTIIKTSAKPATNCPAWKKASGPVPPWGVWTRQWRLEMLREAAQEAWDILPPESRKELEAKGITRP